MQKIRVIDSHTGGEPTRVVVEGGPRLEATSLADAVTELRERHDWLRTATANEPRASDAVVGALMCTPQDSSCDLGVIFFNNVGYLNMCVHGSIGFAVTLVHLGKIGQGEYRFETPVGVVTATVHDHNDVTIANVPSYRYRENVKLEVEGLGAVTGDIAWGGNWFFLVEDHRQEIVAENIEQLTSVAWSIRQALERDGVTGANNGLIDHIELFGPPQAADADSKNFVLCPGKAYDRSPCGTGTSAKLACLYAAGKLRPGEVWRQESIIGSIFEGRVTEHEQGIIPHVRGSAYVTADATLLIDPSDPFACGIPG